MARCSVVQQWNEDAFQKAFKWANYFEEVYRRLQAKPALAEKLNNYLENFNKSGQLFLGNLKMSLEVLGKSKSLLRRFLLQNRHLSECQYQWMLKLYDVTVGETQDCSKNENLLTDATHLSQNKGAFQLLCKMRSRLTEDMTFTPHETPEASPMFTLSRSQDFLTAVGPEEVCINAMSNCLFKHVLHYFKFGDPCTHKVLLTEKLGVLAEQENGLRSILTALLCPHDDCQYEQQSNEVNQFILDWLTEYLSYNEPHPRLMSLPPHLLCRLSLTHDRFCKLYLSQLWSWADSMAPSIWTNEKDCHTNRGVQWRYMVSGALLQDDQASSQNHLSFPNLLNHLSHLVTGPDFIADVAKNEMRSRLVERYSTGTHACNDSLSSNLNIWEDIFELIHFNFPPRSSSKRAC